MIHGMPIRLHGCNEPTTGVTTEGSDMNTAPTPSRSATGDVIEFTHRGERRTAEVMIRSDDDQVLLDLFDGDRPAFAQLSALADVAVFRPDASGSPSPPDPPPAGAGAARPRATTLAGMRPGIALTVGELADVVGGELTGDIGPADTDHARDRSGSRSTPATSSRAPCSSPSPGGATVTTSSPPPSPTGAACAIVRRGWAAPDPSLPLVRVDDPLRGPASARGLVPRRISTPTSSPSSARSARRRRRTPSSSFLGESTFCYGSPGSFNSQLGVPLSVLGCPLDAELAVFEAAATEPGEMARLVPVLRPDTVVVTTVGDRFRRSFGSSPAFAAELCTLAGTAGRVVCGDGAARRRRLPAGGHDDGDTGVARSGPSRRCPGPSNGASSIVVDGHAIAVPTSSSWVARRRRARRRDGVRARPRARPRRATRRRRSTSRRGGRRPACPCCARLPSTSRWRGAPRWPTRSTRPAGAAGCSSCSATPPTTMSDETLTTLAGITTERSWRCWSRPAGPPTCSPAHAHVPLRVCGDDGRARCRAGRRGDDRRRRGGDRRSAASSSRASPATSSRRWPRSSCASTSGRWRSTSRRSAGGARARW